MNRKVITRETNDDVCNCIIYKIIYVYIHYFNTTVDNHALEVALCSNSLDYEIHIYLRHCIITHQKLTDVTRASGQIILYR